MASITNNVIEYKSTQKFNYKMCKIWNSYYWINIMIFRILGLWWWYQYVSFLGVCSRLRQIVTMSTLVTRKWSAGPSTNGGKQCSILSEVKFCFRNTEQHWFQCHHKLNVSDKIPCSFFSTRYCVNRRGKSHLIQMRIINSVLCTQALCFISSTTYSHVDLQMRNESNIYAWMSDFLMCCVYI